MVQGHQPARQSWRTRVQQWLASVQNHRHAYRVDLRTAATQNRASFPRSLLVVVVGYFVRALAVRIIKSALTDAATELNIQLTAGELDLLADLGASVLLGG
jgi:hypothetical protein